MFLLVCLYRGDSEDIGINHTYGVGVLGGSKAIVWSSLNYFHKMGRCEC